MLDDQVDRCSVASGSRVWSILFAGVSPLAVVHHAGYEEDEEQDDVAGDEYDEVQRHRVDLYFIQHYDDWDSQHTHAPQIHTCKVRC